MTLWGRVWFWVSRRDEHDEQLRETQRKAEETTQQQIRVRFRLFEIERDLLRIRRR